MVIMTHKYESRCLCGKVAMLVKVEKTFECACGLVHTHTQTGQEKRENG